MIQFQQRFLQRGLGLMKKGGCLLLVLALALAFALPAGARDDKFSMSYVGI